MNSEMSTDAKASSNSAPATATKPSKAKAEKPAKTFGLTLITALATVMANDNTFVRRAGWASNAIRIRKNNNSFVTGTGGGFSLGAADLTADDWYVPQKTIASTLQPGQQFIHDNRRFLVMTDGRVSELTDSYALKDFGDREVFINEDAKFVK